MSSSAIQGNIQTGKKFWDSPEVTGSAGRGILMLAQRWGGQALSYEDERALWNFFPPVALHCCCLGTLHLSSKYSRRICLLERSSRRESVSGSQRRAEERLAETFLEAGGSWCGGVLRMPSSVCLYFPFTGYKHAVTRKLYWLKETYIKDFHQLL